MTAARLSQIAKECFDIARCWLLLLLLLLLSAGIKILVVQKVFEGQGRSRFPSSVLGKRRSHNRFRRHKCGNRRERQVGSRSLRTRSRCSVSYNSSVCWACVNCAKRGTKWLSLSALNAFGVSQNSGTSKAHYGGDEPAAVTGLSIPLPASDRP